MKNILILLPILALQLISCNRIPNSDKIVNAKNEIRETELQFEKMAKDSGVAKAFWLYADDSACINRKNFLLKGKEQILNYYKTWPFTEVKLTWKTDFIDVSASCDLGYTYGKFTFSALDTSGNRINSQGHFHTVWKKQKDGSWKYVWD